MEASTAPLRARGAASTALARAAVPQASTVSPWPEPFGPRRALGGGGCRSVGARDGGEHRGGDAVGVEFGAGVQGRRDLAEDTGAQPLFGPGGHPVRGQRQGGGRHEAHQGGRDDGGKRGRHQQG